MSLPTFIRDNLERFAEEWEAYARTLSPTAAQLSPEELRDHVPDLLRAVAADIEVRCGMAHPHDPSQELAEDPTAAIMRYSREHAQTRLHQGFSLVAMAAEYHRLRHAILVKWNVQARATTQESTEHFHFGDSIDAAWMEAMDWYGKQVDHARDFVLGMLGHDLRNPLGAIVTSAHLLQTDRGLQGESAKAVARILRSSARMRELVEQLLAFMRIRLGQRMPVEFAHFDLAEVLGDAVEELHAVHGDVDIRVQAGRDLAGQWDRARIAQMISNLVGNAIEHGDRTKPITLAARAAGDAVLIEVHNEGPPLTPSQVRRLFDPLARGLASLKDESAPSTSVGLGLLIANEIVQAHGGAIDVASSAESGTTFRVRLPRQQHA